MRKRVLAGGLGVLLLVLSIGIVNAQTPFIAVYFDAAYQIEGPGYSDGLTVECPGSGLDTLYVALVNANKYVSGVDFMVDYPPALTWMGDLDTQPVSIGTTPTGLSMGWSLPQNGFSTLQICKVRVLWNCEFCDGLYLNNPVVVVPNPTTFTLGFTDWPDYALFPAVGMTSLICPTIPTEDTTWGKVKSLYSE